MRGVLKAFLLLLTLTIVVGAIGVWYFVNSGVSAEEQPGRVEEFIARNVRTMAIATPARTLSNPVEYSAEVIADGRSHFADHCATCHANDGSGETTIGQSLWPKAPDMRQAPTQNLSDGELFWIIENGIRFTGMPAWGTGTKEGEEASWHLVHFIRRLPKLTPEELVEMESLNPKPPAELFFEHEGNRAIRSGRWKLVSRYPDGWELYDVATDRVERNDLAAHHPALVDRLATAWETWAKRANVDPWTGPRRTNWGDEKAVK